MRPDVFRRLKSVTLAALVLLGVGGCGPPHSSAENNTLSALTGDKGEIKGVLTEVGGPAGSSPQVVQGKVDVYTRKGNQVGDISPVSAWDFELEPGTYSVSAVANGLPCGPVTATVVKAVVKVVPLVCPIK